MSDSCFMAANEKPFDLPVFTEAQKPPALVPYEKAVAAYEEIIEVFKLREQPRIAEEIPEFKL